MKKWKVHAKVILPLGIYEQKIEVFAKTATDAIEIFFNEMGNIGCKRTNLRVSVTKG